MSNENTGCLLTSVTEVLSNISLVFWARDLESYMKVLYYMAFDNQIMIWPLSPTRYFKWLCQKSLKIYTIFTNSSLSSMFFKIFNFEAFRGIFWPWCRKQKSLRIKFYPWTHPLKNFLVHFERFILLECGIATYQHTFWNLWIFWHNHLKYLVGDNGQIHFWLSNVP